MSSSCPLFQRATKRSNCRCASSRLSACVFSGDGTKNSESVGHPINHPNQQDREAVTPFARTARQSPKPTNQIHHPQHHPNQPPHAPQTPSAGPASASTETRSAAGSSPPPPSAAPARARGAGGRRRRRRGSRRGPSSSSMISSCLSCACPSCPSSSCPASAAASWPPPVFVFVGGEGGLVSWNSRGAERLFA